MKFEKMNDQQIRCTLTKEDLDARKIKISELAYGTDKARSLFREMMEQASNELDFEADDIPLMIEAIPINSECIVLTVTKVEDPEELDTRFAQFSPSLLGEDDGNEFAPELTDDDFSNDILNMFNQLKDAAANASAALGGIKEQNGDADENNLNLSRLFSFDNMSNIISASAAIACEYNGTNSVYKDPHTGKYLLLINQSGLSLTTFSRICNIISEYGESERSRLATDAYLEEHFELLIGQNAIQKLSRI